MLVLGREFIQRRTQDAAHIIFQNQFPLIDAFEQLPAQPVHCLALLVHHVVVFENVFPVSEVLAFNAFLGAFDLLRNES